mmetsp:Transcript_13163/g.17888  ORF Transcript_13163/g.17888 Transcript_13163/m.17888 type:complete len:85 (+) Transcript_13163:1327-1581(+)
MTVNENKNRGERDTGAEEKAPKTPVKATESAQKNMSVSKRQSEGTQHRQSVSNTKEIRAASATSDICVQMTQQIIGLLRAEKLK